MIVWLAAPVEPRMLRVNVKIVSHRALNVTDHPLFARLVILKPARKFYNHKRVSLCARQAT